jgi:hypothetical protein
MKSSFELTEERLLNMFFTCFENMEIHMLWKHGNSHEKKNPTVRANQSEHKAKAAMIAILFVFKKKASWGYSSNYILLDADKI